MLRWKVTFLIFIAGALVNCSGGEESALEVTIAPNKTYVINASAKSCTVKREEAGSTDPVANDIEKAFFQFQYMDISWPNVEKTLVVASLRFKFQGPQFEGGSYICEFAGDELLALNDTWFAKGEAAVGGPEIASYSAPGDASQRYTPATLVSINCPIVCGQLNALKAYQATGEVDIIAFSRDSSGEMTPERAIGTVTIESLGY